jgi:hypothetical protein
VSATFVGRDEGGANSIADFFLATIVSRMFPLTAGPQIDHFVDVNKMVGNGVIRDFTGGFCLIDDRGKVAPFDVTQQVLEIASEPKLDAGFGLLGVALESGGQLLNLVGLHARAPRFLQWSKTEISSHHYRAYKRTAKGGGQKARRGERGSG